MIENDIIGIVRPVESFGVLTPEWFGFNSLSLVSVSLMTERKTSDIGDSGIGRKEVAVLSWRSK